MYQTGNEVSSVADAFRGNPQALAQRYSQNQQLIDLLALQKLKSEKDAAARDIQMKMQTSPQTIREQREAELMGRTQEEVASATGNMIQQQQQRQSQAMEQVANSGIASASPKMGFKEGGVVSYAGGGEIESKISKALSMGATVPELEKMLSNNPRALSILAGMVSEGEPSDIPEGQEFEKSKDGSDRKPFMVELGENMGQLGRDAAGIMSVVPGLIGKGRDAAVGATTDLFEGMRLPVSEQANPPLANKDAVDELFPENPQPELREVTPQGQRVARTSLEPTLRETLNSSLKNQLNADDDAAAQRGIAQARDLGMGMTEEDKAAFNRRKSQLEAMQAEMNDPERQRQEQLKQFLLGGAGRRGFGNTMAGSASSSIATRGAQEDRRYQGIGELMALENANRQNRRAAGKDLMSVGENRRDNTEANRRMATQTAGSVLNSDTMSRIKALAASNPTDVPKVILDAAKQVGEAEDKVQAVLESNMQYQSALSDDPEAAAIIEKRVRERYMNAVAPAVQILAESGYAATGDGGSGGMPEGFSVKGVRDN